MTLEFEVEAEDGSARCGIVRMRRGEFHTPAFLPVATLGTVRALDSRDLKELGVEIIIANTLHLHIRPGDELIKKLGGLHKFMRFDGIIATDSGGFQAFSLGDGKEHGVGKIADNIFLEGFRGGEYRGERFAFIDDGGISFRHPLTGERVRLTPELSMRIQRNLGSDITFALDECTSPLADREYTERALERSHRWFLECLKYRNDEQEFFGIVQGGEYRDLREKSAKFLSQFDLSGYGIGGSLGKSKNDMLRILEWVIPILPENKPRHLLGIGGVEDIFNSVERGVDMFDCVSPTRWARRGHLYITPSAGGTPENKFRMNIENAKFREDESPIDESCSCFVCRNYSRAYLRHLYVSNELAYFRLASYHNLHFILRLMEEIRNAIEEGRFLELKKEWLGYV